MSDEDPVFTAQPAPMTVTSPTGETVVVGGATIEEQDAKVEAISSAWTIEHRRLAYLSYIELLWQGNTRPDLLSFVAQEAPDHVMPWAGEPPTVEGLQAQIQYLLDNLVAVAYVVAMTGDSTITLARAVVPSLGVEASGFDPPEDWVDLSN
jgi:hypothetical protein